MDPKPLPKIYGRNGFDDPVTGPDALAMEMLNVDMYGVGVAKKRHGWSAITVDDVGAMVSAANGWTDASVNLADGQMFVIATGQSFVSASALVILTPAYLYSIWSNGSSVFASQYAQVLTYSTSGSDPQAMTLTTINTKALQAGNSTENRLQAIYAPYDAVSKLFRKAGLKAPVAATVGNTGSGGYAATLRYYRIAWTNQSGTTILLRSNLGPTVSFTPSGSGTAARITRPALAGESENNWEIYVSLDDAAYYYLATVASGTTTYDDSTVTTSYTAGRLAPREGSNYPFPSVKYLLTAFNRIMGYGRWESSAGDSLATNDGTLYFSPPRAGFVDAESGSYVEEVVRDCIDERGYLPVSDNATGIDVGIAGPLYGSVYAFQDTRVFQVTPTGAPQAPFRSIELYGAGGAVSHQSLVMAEDETGRPALYYLNPQDGPRRIGESSIEWIGKDVADIWATVNLSASIRSAHGIYVRARKQIWWNICTSASQGRPNRIICLDLNRVFRDETGLLRGGWTTWTGELAGNNLSSAAGAYSMVMCGASLLNPLAAQVPYVLAASPSITASKFKPPSLGRVLFTGQGLEVGGSYNPVGLIRTKAYTGNGKKLRMDRLVVLMQALASGTIQASVNGNFGESGTAQRVTDSIALDAIGSETSILKRADSVDLGQLDAFQIDVGDVTSYLQSATAGSTVGQWTVSQVLTSARPQDTK